MMRIQYTNLNPQKEVLTGMKTLYGFSMAKDVK